MNKLFALLATFGMVLAAPAFAVDQHADQAGEKAAEAHKDVKEAAPAAGKPGEIAKKGENAEEIKDDMKKEEKKH